MSAALRTPEEWLALRQETVNNIEAIIKDVGGLPAVLLAYQQKTVRLLDSVSVLVIEKSRRVGETWALASVAVLKAAAAKNAGGMDAIYISYSQDMTREFIDACAMWAKAYSLVASDAQEFVFEDQKEGEDTRSIQAFRIRFDSGFEIVGLSSAPRSLRGKQGLVIIDEAAFVDHLAELLKAALALLMWGGQVVICSTHNGTENPFNQLVQDILSEKQNYALLKIDFDQALADGLFKRICLVQGKDWSPEAETAWREEIIGYYGDAAEEELFCVPTMGTGAWLNAPLIESRMVGTGEILSFTLPPDYLQRSDLDQKQLMAPIMEEVKRACDKFDPDRQHAAGFDFARKGDLSVLPILEIGKTLGLDCRLTLEFRQMPYDEQLQILYYVFDHLPRPVGAAFDATGSGEYIAEAMARKYGLAAKELGAPGGLIAAIKITADWYRLNMGRVKAAFEDASITLAKSDDHVGDLRLVKVIRGIPMIPDDRTGKAGAKRHGDFAVGLALAFMAAKMRYVEYGYVAVPQQNQRNAHRHENHMHDFPDHSGDIKTNGDDYMSAPLGASLRGSF
jgi:phage FluMu gp28-like protein